MPRLAFVIYTDNIIKNPIKFVSKKLNIIFLIQNSREQGVVFPPLGRNSKRRAVMRLFCGLISVHNSSYIIEAIKPFITDVNSLSLSKSMTNYFTKYISGYFRL